MKPQQLKSEPKPSIFTTCWRCGSMYQKLAPCCPFCADPANADWLARWGKR
jgi:hypothetical protein